MTQSSMHLPCDLHDLGLELLAASVEALDTIPDACPELAGAPGRTFVSSGRPAFDNCCADGGQLTVHAAQVVPKITRMGLDGTAQRIGFWINHVTFNITIARCVPSADGNWAEAPTPTQINAASAQTDADAWALWNHLANMVRSGLLLTLCDEVFFDGMRALDPSGGCGGWVLVLRAQLDGYNETLGT